MRRGRWVQRPYLVDIPVHTKSDLAERLGIFNGFRGFLFAEGFPFQLSEGVLLAMGFPFQQFSGALFLQQASLLGLFEDSLLAAGTL